MSEQQYQTHDSSFMRRSQYHPRLTDVAGMVCRFGVVARAFRSTGVDESGARAAASTNRVKSRRASRCAGCFDIMFSFVVSRADEVEGPCSNGGTRERYARRGGVSMGKKKEAAHPETRRLHLSGGRANAPHHNSFDSPPSLV